VRRRILSLVLATAGTIPMGLGTAAAPVSAATFSDIAGSAFQVEIEWLVSEGITSGCGGGKFCPTRPVTRAEMASFLVRMFGYTAVPPQDPYDDDDGTFHEPDINKLTAAGVTSGCGPRLFCPRASVTRGQMAAFLERALGLYFGAGSDHFADDDGLSFEPSLDRVAFANISRGCGVERACPASSVTREQMAAFLYRSEFATPIGPPGFANVVSYPTPLTVQFTGPARFRGVAFSADGAIATKVHALGAIKPTAAPADSTALVNGVRYAHLVSGALAGSWVKVDGSLTKALGRSPSPPACTYADILTSRRDPTQHAITLLDTTYMLPSNYAPGDLVSTSTAGLNGGFSIRAIVRDDLAAMANAARAAGTPIQVVSAYRSYSQQVATFQYWVDVSGYAAALRKSARPGHSEHQLGTTLDFTVLGGSPPWEYPDWAATAAGAWMKSNAWKYGFVMSYPAGGFAATCYDYEPWHYRYVGKPLAEWLHTSGMTLREATWRAHGP
jgi:zinc D-Ala-D-Ala carboxypeptidase